MLIPSSKIICHETHVESSPSVVKYPQNSNPTVCGTHSPANWITAHKPTESPRIQLQNALQSPCLWWANPHTYIYTYMHAWMHAYIHTCIHTYIHTYLVLLISMLWHRQAIFKSKGDMLCSSAECRIWTRGPRHQFASRLNAHWQTDWAIEDQAKTWTRQLVPMISEHSAHLAPLSVDFRTWLWRYTYLVLLISILWHRQAIFKSKGDKLCSSAECRIWTRGPRHQIASRLNAHWRTDWAIEDQAKTWTR